MNLNQTFSTLFWLHKAKMNSKGFAPIWARITIDGRRAECSTKKYILPEHWDAEKGEAKTQCPDAKVINDYLLNRKAEINKRYNILLTTMEYVSAEDVKENLKGDKVKIKTFFEVYDEFKKFHEKRMEKKELSPGRFKRLEITYGKCKKFISYQYKKRDLPLDQVQHPFIVQFHHYLVTEDNLGNNTAMKHAKDLKQVLEYATTMRYLVANPLRAFRCKTKKVKRTYLDQAELDRLASVQFSTERLEQVRDCFLFSCYSGYAFSDAKALTPESISIGIDGGKWILRDRQKTDNAENVPLLPQALQIIEKYKDHPYCLSKNRLLPIKSNVHYNEYLKEVADLASINKRLTTHVARHTFATTICITNGVPIETVKELLAHDDIRTTQIYAEAVPVKVSADMKTLRKKIAVKEAKREAKTGIN